MTDTIKAMPEEVVIYRAALGKVEDDMLAWLLTFVEPINVPYEHAVYVRADLAHQEALDVEALKREAYTAHIKSSGLTDEMIAEELAEDPDWEWGYNYGCKSAVDAAIDHLANRLNTPIPESRKAEESAFKSLVELRDWLFKLVLVEETEPDGFDIQDKLEKLGLIVGRPATAEDVEKGFEGDEGDAIFCKAPLTHPAPKDSWQPIETAPRDGTMFLGAKAEAANYPGPMLGYFCAYWSKEYDCFMYSFERPCSDLTHWMPLPAPPEAKAHD